MLLPLKKESVPGKEGLRASRAELGLARAFTDSALRTTSSPAIILLRRELPGVLESANFRIGFLKGPWDEWSPPPLARGHNLHRRLIHALVWHPSFSTIITRLGTVAPLFPPMAFSAGEDPAIPL